MFLNIYFMWVLDDYRGNVSVKYAIKYPVSVRYK